MKAPGAQLIGVSHCALGAQEVWESETLLAEQPAIWTLFEYELTHMTSSIESELQSSRRLRTTWKCFVEFPVQ